MRPGGLKNDPEREVGNLILREEDVLRAKKSDPATAISRETVSLHCFLKILGMPPDPVFPLGPISSFSGIGV